MTAFFIPAEICIELKPVLNDARSAASAGALAVKRGDEANEAAVALATSDDAMSQVVAGEDPVPCPILEARLALSSATWGISVGMTETRNEYSVE